MTEHEVERRLRIFSIVSSVSVFDMLSQECGRGTINTVNTDGTIDAVSTEGTMDAVSTEGTTEVLSTED